MNILDKFFITEINLVSQIRPQIKDLTLNTYRKIALYKSEIDNHQCLQCVFALILFNNMMHRCCLALFQIMHLA